MRIGLLDIEERISVNNLKEVTSPVMLSSKMLYDPNGIFSNEIFGMSKTDRRSNFGYIDLKGHYLHPHIYLNVLKKGVFRNIVNLVNGTKTFSVINKSLELDPEGWTGLEKLYENWDKIDWNKIGSANTIDISLLNGLPRDEAFITKTLVCPPAYRDIMIGSGTSERIHELNTMYTTIIRAVIMLQEGGIFAKTQYATQAKIQETLAEINMFCENQISKKTGLIRQYLLGKRVDYSSRSVISAYSYNSNSIEDNMIGLEYTALPISQCCACFMPFIESWLKNFFTRELINNPNKFIYYDENTKQQIAGTILNPELQFNDKEIVRLILDYIRNPNNRFAPIEVDIEVNDNKGYKTAKVQLLLKGKHFTKNNITSNIIRPMTITDLLYLASVEVCERRHVMVTRYPVGTDKGMFLNRINVQSTRKHIKLIYNDKEYPFYPDIDLSIPHERVGVEFIDTTVFSNSMLKGLGGD